MCINMRQLRLSSGLSAEVPCHTCWQCRADRVRNWTGKCLAESKTSVAVDFVTLSYCDQGSKAAHWIKEPVQPGYATELHYEDVQKYLKRIRKAGHSVRYVCAGEYGSRKGRAHWHIILFWQSPRPKRRKLYGNEWQDQFWHHGHVNYQRFDEAAAKYVCKYLLKWDTEQEQDRRTKFNFSARPGIGFNWICDNWAQLHVDNQLAPQGPHYTFPDIRKDGKPTRFKMTPHCQVKFVLDYERRWKEKWGNHSPPSAFVEKCLDKVASRYVSDALERRKFVYKPDIPTPNGEKVFFDEKLNSFYFDCGGFRALRFYWSYDSRGCRAWSRDIVTPSQAARFRADWALETQEWYRTATGRSSRAA